MLYQFDREARGILVSPPPGRGRGKNLFFDNFARYFVTSGRSMICIESMTNPETKTAILGS